MSTKAKHGSGFLGQAFDVIFVMALCFATLFASMILNGPVIVGTGATGQINYMKSITPTSVTIVVVILAVYLVYLLRRSSQQLHNVVDTIYGDDDQPVADDAVTTGQTADATQKG